MRKGRRRVVARNSRNKVNTVKHKIITFTPIIALGNFYSCITVVEWYSYGVENTAGNARRCRIHSKNSSRFHPGNRAEVFIWQNFQPAYRDPDWKNRDLGNRASPPSHMNTSKIL